MTFEIKLTPEAEEPFDAVITQLRDRWSNTFVTKFEDKISKVLDIISITPDIFPVVNENMQIRRCLLHKNCSMLYKINNDIILIICFWDNRQERLIF